MANTKKADKELKEIRTVQLWNELQIDLVGGKAAANKIMNDARDGAIIKALQQQSLTACAEEANNAGSNV